MAQRVEIDMPWPPSVNTYWRSVPARRRGIPGASGGCCRVLLSRAGRAYRREACARLAAWRDRRPLEGRLSVSVQLLPPTRRALDIDNRLKGLLDALQHAGVIRDDGQIDRLVVERGPVNPGGVVRVEIEPME